MDAERTHADRPETAPSARPIEVLVAGHLCLDLSPAMGHLSPDLLVRAGALHEVGALVISTGGAVANTGLALVRLGVETGLMAAIGDDGVGEMTRAYLTAHAPNAVLALHTETRAPSSYSVVLAPAETDRVFLHCVGVNAHFGYDTFDWRIVEAARIVHLGYPPLLPRLYSDGGEELARIVAQIRARGALVSLDMSLPDRQAAAGRADWRAILNRVLHSVDIFVPSIEEIVFMLRPALHARWHEAALDSIAVRELDAMADELLAFGPSIVGFKLGAHGLYMKTHRETARLSGLVDAQAWSDVRIVQRAFVPAVFHNSTGAGDCAFAGLLTALLRGLEPARAAQLACAVGACSVEAPTADGGIVHADAALMRIDAGWPLSTRGLMM
jgi:sugar/nucleoside kinase (ribokinase family)